MIMQNICVRIYDEVGRSEPRTARLSLTRDAIEEALMPVCPPAVTTHEATNCSWSSPGVVESARIG
jgi:hypothetical protein